LSHAVTVRSNPIYRVPFVVTRFIGFDRATNDEPRIRQTTTFDT